MRKIKVLYQIKCLKCGAIKNVTNEYMSYMDSPIDFGRDNDRMYYMDCKCGNNIKESNFDDY